MHLDELPFISGTTADLVIARGRIIVGVDDAKAKDLLANNLPGFLISRNIQSL